MQTRSSVELVEPGQFPYVFVLYFPSHHISDAARNSSAVRLDDC